jgi:hypothetical protein
VRQAGLGGEPDAEGTPRQKSTPAKICKKRRLPKALENRKNGPISTCVTWEQINSPLQNMCISTKGGNTKEVLQTVGNAECDREVMAVINVNCNCAQGDGYSNHKRSAHGLNNGTGYTCTASGSGTQPHTHVCFR